MCEMIVNYTIVIMVMKVTNMTYKKKKITGISDAHMVSSPAALCLWLILHF